MLKLTSRSIDGKLVFMSISEKLLSEILASAKASGVNQRDLARASGRAPETVSRAKKRAAIELDTLEALASAAGLKLVLQPMHVAASIACAESSLAAPEWGLAWSNKRASVKALVTNSLLRGSFTAVLEAVLEHGMPFVRNQWAFICASQDMAPKPKIRGYTANMLNNIEKGLQDAST